jgi:hypothetical protein
MRGSPPLLRKLQSALEIKTLLKKKGGHPKDEHVCVDGSGVRANWVARERKRHESTKEAADAFSANWISCRASCDRNTNAVVGAISLCSAP